MPRDDGINGRLVRDIDICGCLTSNVTWTQLTNTPNQGLIFSIKPVSKGPKSPDGPFAFNYSGFVLCMTAINMVLDVIVVCMPLSVIRTLQMSSTRKAQVSGVFLLGLL